MIKLKKYLSKFTNKFFLYTSTHHNFGLVRPINTKRITEEIKYLMVNRGVPSSRVLPEYIVPSRKLLPLHICK